MIRNLWRFLYFSLFVSAVFPFVYGQPFNEKELLKISPNGKYLIKIENVKETAKVSVFETTEMNAVAKWEIPETTVQAIHFSPKNPFQVLLVGLHKWQIYQLDQEKQKPIYSHSTDPKQTISNAAFDYESGSIIWSSGDLLHLSDYTKNEHISFFPNKNQKKKKINSFTPLAGNKVAITQKDDSEIHILSFDERKELYTLHGHKAPVIGLQSPRGETLFSVDKSNELVVWDIPGAQILSKKQLGHRNKDGKIVGFTLDDKRENLLIIFEQPDKKSEGRKYDLRELAVESIALNPVKEKLSVTKTGQVFEQPKLEWLEKIKKNTFVQTSPPVDDILKKLQKKEPKGPTFYELAKVEFEGRNFSRALDFVKRIPPTDPEYLKAVQLKQQISREIKTTNKLDLAVEEYRHGQNENAKILLEEILANRPEDIKAAKYYRLVKKKLLQETIIGWFFFIAIFFLLLLIILLLIRFKNVLLGTSGNKPKTEHHPEGKPTKSATSAKEKTAPAEKKDTSQSEKEHQNAELQQNFILALERTKKALFEIRLMEEFRSYENRINGLEAELNLIIRKSKRNNPELPLLIRQLEELELIIKGLRETSTQHKEPNKKKAKNNFVNYYQVLGVKKNASEEEIKEAYRKKMQEYHPDKHHSAGFEWIKEEANRMTQLTQEAYTTLNDVRSRLEYNRKLKIFEEE